MPPLFITGASGFIGVHLLRLLRETGTGGVTCLARRPDALAHRVAPLPGWEYVPGDLCHPADYQGHIPPGAVVLHLAAATGRAPAEEHRRVNVEGTRALLAGCRSAGAARVILVSSIAAKFADQRHYAYAQSKVEAERVVRESGVPHLIVRPTMVLGEGSPILAGLQRLAGGAVGLVFGRGQVRVQPIDVGDLARILFRLACDPSAPVGATLELGGPETVSMEEMLRRIRHRAAGRTGPIFHLPLDPLRATLAGLEVIVGTRIPVTAGQLASFSNDGVAVRHPWVDEIGAELRGLDAMLTASSPHHAAV